MYCFKYINSLLFSIRLTAEILVSICKIPLDEAKDVLVKLTKAGITKVSILKLFSYEKLVDSAVGISPASAMLISTYYNGN